MRKTCGSFADDCLENTDIVYNHQDNLYPIGGWITDKPTESYCLGGGYDCGVLFQGVALHELGHAIGLAHNEGQADNGDYMSVMNYEHPYAIDDHLMPDDVKYIYDKFPNKSKMVIDVGIWAYTSDGFESFSRATATPTTVSVGEDVYVEGAYLGNLSHPDVIGSISPGYEFFLSEDTAIDSGDISIGGPYLDSAIDEVSGREVNENLTIPDNVASGEYYIGIVAYANGNLDSIDYNNTAYLKDKITISKKTAPVLNIKANNSDEPITISTSDQLDITISLDSGSYYGINADWWLFVYTPSGRQTLGTLQSPLSDLNSYSVYSVSGLDAGAYTYYFAIDLNPNGVLDENDQEIFFSDSVEVTVSGVDIIPPTGFTASVSGSTVTLNWNAVSGAEGYKLYYGFSSGVYIASINLGNTTSKIISNVPDGTYYLAVTAYAGDVESGYSNEEPIKIESSPPCANVAGTWNVTEFWNVGNSCDMSGGVETYPITITQNGCNLTINDEGTIDTATINGNTFSYVWEDSEYNSDAGGTVGVVEPITITVSGNSFTGSSTWDSTFNGAYSCSGTSTYTGTKQ